MNWLIVAQSLRPQLSPRTAEGSPENPGRVLNNLPDFLNRRCSILKLCGQNYVW